jgi:maleate cis-trans isomerase
MTALGFLYPGHSAEDDYPRIEQLLGSDIRLPLVHTDIGEDAHRVDALLEMGSTARLAAGVEELRLSGAEAVVWACTSGSFVYGWEGAREQVDKLSAAAGVPASSTSFAFVHAARALGIYRVAVAASYPDDVAKLFVEFLSTGGIEVVSMGHADITTAAEVGELSAEDVVKLALSHDHPAAEAVLVPDTAMRTLAEVNTIENALRKPVLTANQVTVWEGLRLTGETKLVRSLGALFRRRSE